MIINGVNYGIDIKGEGKPIVLLHGFTSNMHTWDELTNLLKENYKVIRIDIIGHGSSDSPEDSSFYTIEKQVEAIKEILNNLKINECSLLGYSMGGRLAITFACLYPQLVTSLILESTTAGIESEEERIMRRKHDEILAEKISTEGLDSFVRYWENISLFNSLKKIPEEIQLNIRKQRLSNNSIGLINSLLMMGTGSQPNWWDTIPNFNFPVLILAGNEDKKFCTIGEKLSKKIKNAQFVIINDAGHIIHVENSKKFGTIVKEFLKAHIN